MIRRGIASGFCLAVSCALSAQAGLLDYWPIDEGSGSVTYNAIAGRTNGTLQNTPTWITDDPVRGTCLSFNGSDERVAAGILHALSLSADFTWSFWANQDSNQPVNNDVILGNRFGGTGSPLQFIKFTARMFEYYHGGLYGVDYADVPSGTWIHHAVVKDGNTLTYYRDGVFGGSSTISFDEDANPFYFGGDGGECWQGRIDDVSLWSSALSAADIAALASGASPFAVLPEPGSLALLAVGCLALARRRRRGA